MIRFPMVEPEEVGEQEIDDVVAGLPDMYSETQNVDGDHLKTGVTHRTLANNPELHELHNRTFLTLWQEDLTGLEPKETELVILTTAREFGPVSGANMWNNHTQNAVLAGWDEDEIAAIATGDAGALPEKYAALMRYAAAVANRTVTDELHEELAQYYDHGTIAGAMMLGGYYALCNHIKEAITDERVPVDPEYAELSFDSLVGVGARS